MGDQERKGDDLSLTITLHGVFLNTPRGCSGCCFIAYDRCGAVGIDEVQCMADLGLQPHDERARAFVVAWRLTK